MGAVVRWSKPPRKPQQATLHCTACSDPECCQQLQCLQCKLCSLIAVVRRGIQERLDIVSGELVTSVHCDQSVDNCLADWLAEMVS